MCDVGQLRGDEARALCHLRFFVYREYREIRHLGSTIQHGDYEHLYPKFKAIRAGDSEDRIKGALARQLYMDTSQESDIRQLLERFREQHELTLEDVLRILREAPQQGAYGGPAHAAIVAELMKLRDAIVQGTREDATACVQNLRRMQHNTKTKEGKTWFAIDDYRDLQIPGPCCVLE